MAVEKETREVSHTVDNDNFIVRDHQVHGIRTLPGVALLDMIYRSYEKCFGTTSIKLTNILFKKPIVTSESFSQNVIIYFERGVESTKVLVTSRKVNVGSVGHPDEEENMECLACAVTPPKHANFNVDLFIESAESNVDMQEIYDTVREIGVCHFDFMRTQGVIYRKGDEELMALSLSPASEPYRKHFAVHPAFMDSATFAGVSLKINELTLQSSGDDSAFIPFFIESFTAYETLPKTIFIHSRSRLETDKAKQDISSIDIQIYNREGKLLVDFINLTTKRIREPELIRKLIRSPTDGGDQAVFPVQTDSYDDTNKNNVLEKTLSEFSALSSIDPVKDFLKERIGLAVNIKQQKINTKSGFYDLGLDSAQLLGLVKEIEHLLQTQLYPTLLFEYNTIDTLAEYLFVTYGETLLTHMGKCGTACVEISEGLSEEPSEQLSGGELLRCKPIWKRQGIYVSGAETNTKKRIVISIGKEVKAAIQDFLMPESCQLEWLEFSVEKLPIDFEKNCIVVFDIVKNALIEHGKSGCLVQLIVQNNDIAQWALAFGGLLKVAALENSNFFAQVILLDTNINLTPNTVEALLNEEACGHQRGYKEIRYKYPMLRDVRTLEPLDVPRDVISDVAIYKDGGVYLITGGAGGIGIKLAERIAKKAKVRIVLIGRRPFDENIANQVGSLLRYHATVDYFSVDLADQLALEGVLSNIRSTIGQIVGVFHCAGSVNDRFIINKTSEDMRQVFSPKVGGLWNLDELTKNDALDFFVLFSSISAITGNIGQADYVAANSFMDVYVHYRQSLVAQGKRHGKNVAINWPHWESGGMQISSESHFQSQVNLGVSSMPMEIGLNTLEAIVQGESLREVIFYGDVKKILHSINYDDFLHSQNVSSDTEKSNQGSKNTISNTLSEKVLQDSVFKSTASNDVVIVGISGRYPMAKTLEEFYRNLREGRNCITEIPEDRWSGYDFGYDVSAIYRFGGFIDGVDLFDPLFFSLAPRSATTLDPQARVFLECAWQACQDAGFLTRSMYTKDNSTLLKSVGVFAGVFWNDYELYAAVSAERGKRISFGNSAASIANLTSHCLDLHGPSMAVDTMCSSSLTAIHLACESIKHNQCEYALAGGVNIVSHPHRYTFLTDAGFLSSEGKCRSFGEGGDGYVPGEGVGVILLSSFATAVEKGHTIYGIIRGSAINHGGKTSGLSVPDPVSQAAVITQALKNANVASSSISYIEAHGTGTSLGDPIEIHGLTKAYQLRSKRDHSCAVGSVKSNVGHLEAAAGIAGLTKILLQFKYREIFPNLHSEITNKNIPFEHSSFHVPSHLETWDIQKKSSTEAEVQPGVRRAALSSFGASGSNAHIILEEYIAPDAERLNRVRDQVEYILPFSARNRDGLKQYCQEYINYITAHEELNNSAAMLVDIAYILRFCRDEMDARLAVCVKSTRNLLDALRSFVHDDVSTNVKYYFHIVTEQDVESSLLYDDDFQITVESWIAKKKYQKIAEAWAKGLPIEWVLFNHKNEKYQRISLPVPPLANKSYWAPRNLANKPIGKFDGLANQALSNMDLSKESIQSNPASTMNEQADIGEERSFTKDPGIASDQGSILVMSYQEIYRFLTKSLSQILFLDGDEPDPSKQFSELGLDSIIGVEWIKEINKHYLINLKASVLYDNANITTLSSYLYETLARVEIPPDNESGVRQETLENTLDSGPLKPSAKMIHHGGRSKVSVRLSPLDSSLGGQGKGRVQDEYHQKTPDEVDREITIHKAPDLVSGNSGNIEHKTREVAFESLLDEVIDSFSKIMFMDKLDLSLDRQLVDMGLDSIIGVEWIRELNKTFGLELKATILYEYSTVRSLVSHLFDITKGRVRDSDIVAGSTNSETSVNSESLPDTTDIDVHGDSILPSQQATASVTRKPLRPLDSLTNIADGKADKHSVIAIIGQSGRYPGSSNLEEFWINLKNGINSVREIPKYRWDVNEYYDPVPTAGKIYSKNLGVLEDIEYFDPLFFNISPHEAEGMDPQQRMFLQEAYRAFEDAGYGPQALNNTNCGVYLGIMNNEYSKIVAYYDTEGSRGNTTGNSYAIAVSRIAYYLNLRGPAIPIDTACSSSLVGVHLACQALRSGEVDMGLVGGVTLYLIPESYMAMCSAGMLSPDGQCKAFDNSANGFVPGEGVGCLVLKRLSDAEQSNDNIQGVILGSGINQDGKTNGITAPSMKSQAELATSIYQRYGIDVTNIGYAEMHGTGTQIGDPIELEALSSAFAKQSLERNFCAIGSVKTNIGHISAAAGVASVQKVLLLMKHRQLVPTLNFQKPNEHFDFENSPFYVNTESKYWEAKGELPRCATVSSFGFSGTNAHLVLQEYNSKILPILSPTENIFVLSARTMKELKSLAENLMEYLSEPGVGRVEDIAYTLQVGRAQLKHRLAWIASNIEETQSYLQDFLDHKNSRNWCYGEVDVRNLDSRHIDAHSKSEIQDDLSKRNFSAVAKKWVSGNYIDWTLRNNDIKCQRISLPTYGFARDRYWVAGTENSSKPSINVSEIIPVKPGGVIQPFLHVNSSNLSQQCYTTHISGDDDFVSDHRLNGQQILPGVVYIEMARAALINASVNRDQSSVVRFQHLAWIEVLKVDPATITEIHIGLYPEQENRVDFEVYSLEGSTGKVFCQGAMSISEKPAPQPIKLAEIEASWSGKTVSGAQLYKMFSQIDMDYGDCYQCVETMYPGGGQVITKLKLPPTKLSDLTQCVTHPSLLDAALHSTIGLRFGADDSKPQLSPIAPFALESLEVFAPCREVMWAWARPSINSVEHNSLEKFDIDVCDDTGRVCVQMRGFCVRTLVAGNPVGQEVVFFAPKLETIDDAAQKTPYDFHSVVHIDLGKAGHLLGSSLSLRDIPCTAIEIESESPAARFNTIIKRLIASLRELIAITSRGEKLLQVVVSSNMSQSDIQGISSLLKTASQEDPKTTCQLVVIDLDATQYHWGNELERNSRSRQGSQIIYCGGKRNVSQWQSLVRQTADISAPWRESGCYVISGGAGSLGRIFAKQIVNLSSGAHVILLGRSTNAEVSSVLAKLGKRVIYRQVDVCEAKQVRDVMEDIQRQYGPIHGIIHGASVIKDGLISSNSDDDDLGDVLSPKVDGLINLDHASQAFDLDFFVALSSVDGALGAAGQAYSASANGFINGYMIYRDQLQKAGKREGKSVAMAWSHWRDCNKYTSADRAEKIQAIGLEPLDTVLGFQTFNKALAYSNPVVLVLQGNRAQLDFLLNDTSPTSDTRKQSDSQQIGQKDAEFGEVRAQCLRYFREKFAKQIKLDVAAVDVHANLENYGFDSIMAVQMTNTLEREFGVLPKTLLFEYPTIFELTQHFISEYNTKLLEVIGVEGKDNHGNQPIPALETSTLDSLSVIPTYHGVIPRCLRPGSVSRIPDILSKACDTDIDPLGERGSESPRSKDIAIIGVSGSYPEADTIDEFWQNLQEGKDCIREVPNQRWNHAQYVDEDQALVGKTYARWGGFLRDVDKFDPLFFNISPSEASHLDPHERLFLQCVHHTLEDAGYTSKRLSENGNVSVYVGVMYQEYQLYSVTMNGYGYAFPGNPSSVANRTSYYFNFRGESLAIDTMCSSSLTAIHLACQSIIRKDCEVAIAGGVNVSIHVNKFLIIGQTGFASSKGRCQSFGEGGDGYVPGEGVGAVLLKPLKSAIKSGDQIYGVIKGTAVNHGGKTNGYTVPNPRAQADVIKKALRESGIDPRTLSYIEAHGTGTALGDPIEIAGLAKAFDTKDTQFCPIGSAKSIIGHCESAAGIAGVTKVLLQLKHKQIAPSLHSDILNPNIDFDKTPFYVQRSLVDWLRPVIEVNGVKKEFPRRAGISGFGAGGSNAHVIIEEYEDVRMTSTSERSSRGRNVVIVLSARNSKQLHQYVESIIDAIRKDSKRKIYSDTLLPDIAYTLQVGREMMDERLGVEVKSIAELQSKLSRFLSGEKDIDNLYSGNIKCKQDSTLSLFSMDEDLEQAIESWIKKRKYRNILELWVKGLDFDWLKLNKHEPDSAEFRRVSLPTYPFEQERCWIMMPDSTTPSVDGDSIGHNLHPFLHRNTSKLYSENRYTTNFEASDTYIKDHIIHGKKVLPGAIYIEMVRAAINDTADELLGNGRSFQFRDISFSNMVNIETGRREIQLGLFPDDGGVVHFEVYSENNDGGTLHCDGLVVTIDTPDLGMLDLSELKDACQDDVILQRDFYQRYAAMGMQYGESLQAVEKLYRGKSGILAQLQIPVTRNTESTGIVLHPSIIDAALQTCIYVKPRLEPDQLSTTLWVPFSIDRIDHLYPCAERMWCYARLSSNINNNDNIRKYDIDIADGNGQIAVKMKGFCVRAIHIDSKEPSATSQTSRAAVKPNVQTLYYQRKWQNKIVSSVDSQLPRKHKIVCCELGQYGDTLREAFLDNQDAEVVCLNSEYDSVVDRYNGYVKDIILYIRKIFIAERMQDCLLQLLLPSSLLDGELGGLSALLKTAQQENPKCVTQIIGVEQELAPAEQVALLYKNAGIPVDQEVLYKHNVRYISSWQKLPLSLTSSFSPWRENGTYVISGGAGGLGILFAEEIVRFSGSARVVLVGRSVLSAERQERIEKLGSRVRYQTLDINQVADVRELVKNIKNGNFPLRGIIHSAGVIRDNIILKKAAANIQDVLRPKTTGLHNIDVATAHVELDFFVAFSSVAGSLGSVGQSDYGSANAFMDSYMTKRREKEKAGKRFGKSISIAWPFWNSEGMQVSDGVRTKMEQLGLHPLSVGNGITAFYCLLNSEVSRVLVLEGIEEKIKHWLCPEVKLASQHTVNSSLLKLDQNKLRTDTKILLTGTLAKLLNLSSDRIESDVSFDIYGIDSVAALNITRTFERFFGPLPKTLLYENQSVDELVEYFILEHASTLDKILYPSASKEITNRESGENAVEHIPFLTTASDQAIPRFMRRKSLVNKLSLQSPPINDSNYQEINSAALDIAVIGLAGSYAAASNIQQFWQNLKSGKDGITEVPIERWDHSRFYQESKGKPGKTYAKWGGFIEDYDKFDPMFFNISPREAIGIDPQERLFLQCAQHTLEDAGYTSKTLSKNGNVGVFVGVMYQEYQLHSYMGENFGFALPGNSSSVANRVSHCFNFHGVSMAIDTMCSSSLTAIHFACQNIASGEIEAAIAGGVNLSLHVNKFLILAQTRFASSDGRCKSFGDGGDGYVPGEGVGAILLKPLANAEAGNDHIYGVIKSTAVNHGGKTHGYTVPNPKAQGELISRALSKANIDPRSISYIEAHGTGTALGDPIEIAGLTKAFKTKEKRLCAIGSVKSNIGHCESAAGIAGVTKVLLQMKYKLLVPSLHCSVQNENIEFENTPFYVQQQLSEWRKTSITIEDKNVIFPRRAGISAFGAGGSNAHVIIEEYVDQNTMANDKPYIPEPVIIVVSAKTKEQLFEYAKNLLLASCDADRSSVFCDAELKNIAYTLQVGRDSYNYRLGMIVNSVDELKDKLAAFVSGNADIQDVYYGNIEVDNELRTFSDDDETQHKTTEDWGDGEKFQKILDRWVKGFRVDWSSLYPSTDPGDANRRLSLPVYPFAKVACWPTLPSKGASASALSMQGSNADLNRQYDIDDKKSSIFLDSSANRVLEQAPTTSVIADNIADSNLIVVQEWLLKLFSQELILEQSTIGINTPFNEFGVDSIMIVQFIDRMDKELGGITLDPSMILEHPTLASLAKHIAVSYPDAVGNLGIPAGNKRNFSADLPVYEQIPEQQLIDSEVGSQETAIFQVEGEEIPKENIPVKGEKTNHAEQQKHKRKVAVVGLACHFPDAKNSEEFWRNLVSGKDSIGEVPQSRWKWQDYCVKDSHGTTLNPGSKWGAFLDDVESFDPSFFNIPEKEAAQIDPLIRQWLEVSVEALADAGYGKKDLWSRRVGVFAGARSGTFSYYAKQPDSMPTISGTTQNFIAAYLSQVRNFQGPNMVVDTACSSALTAIHLAVQSVSLGESIIALAGGVEVLLDATQNLSLGAAQVLSPDGRCKTFDESANGIGLGEGCGILVLKDLESAIADKNKIYAVIDGSAINNDGTTMGITTPNPDAQREVIQRAIDDAGIDPGTISYVETHGTGTRIGDPIELRGLTQILGGHRQEKQYCGVGSVKSNVGHLLSAAGAAGIIKVLLSLIHKKIPPTLHCSKPNPRFKFENSPLYPVQQLTNWLSADGILRAGISSFGLGGNNAHIILSNEGIPEALRASLLPLGEKVVFNKSRYWHTSEEQDPTVEDFESDGSTKLDSDSDEFEDEFAEFLDL